MRFDPAEADARLRSAVESLERRSPTMSARHLLDRRQARLLGGLALVTLAGLVLAPIGTLIVLVVLVTLAYVLTLSYRVLLFVWSARDPALVIVTDEEAMAVPDRDLPVYTVLVPAYREPEVVEPLIAHLVGLEYPADRLDIKLLLEADDTETVEAARQAPGADRLDLVLVPPGEPRTKPKALNFGLGLARGDYVTIFDAEDQPDPWQLRRAVAAFARAGSDVACFQAKLVFGNSEQNLITRWFTTEYVLWFSLFLPGLARASAPLPLGGTSNHFRRSVLEQLGGWDPFNVTEDADLGIRLHRQGWKARVLESPTVEEANSDFVNWVKQRSRWYKGYIQTWLVHLRQPRRLWEQVGWRGFVQFNLFVGGTPLLSLVNPLFWFLTLLWFVAHPAFVRALFPAPIYYVALTCWALGNFAIAYLALLASKLTGRPSLVLAACLSPLYWVMMAIGAVKALWQLLTAPSFWEKTMHGLTPAFRKRAGEAAQRSEAIHSPFG